MLQTFKNTFILLLTLVSITGCSEYLSTMKGLTPPEDFAITNTSTGSSKIAVFWSASPEASSYEVLYKLNGTTSYLLAGSTTSLQYEIPGLTHNSLYDVRIRAKNLIAETYSTNIETVLVTGANGAPIAWNISSTLVEDVQKTITLSYYDVDGDLAASCNISSVTSVTVTSACACAAGVCTVGITGTSNYAGSASFTYTVTDPGGETSNDATASLTLTNTADAPVTADFSPPAFIQNTQSIITIPYTDPDSDKATSCTLSSLNNITVTQACACNGSGVCTVGVTGTTNFSGAASFDFEVVANGQASNVSEATFTIGVFDATMVTSNISPAAFDEDLESIITLSYTDGQGDLATTCSISPIANVTETTPCSCDGAGVCTVGVTGTLNYNGTASFAYIVGDGSGMSNSSVASLVISAVDDTPVAANITPAAMTEEAQSIITLSYTDVEGNLATSCNITSVTGVTVTQACACNGAGVCTVGVTGTLNTTGAANFTYTVTSLGLTSIAKTATLTINNVDDAPVTVGITPAAFDEDLASIITLSYSDIESGLATSCSISALTNVTVTTACACDGAGVCTVGVTGTADYFGAASFGYTVTVTGAVSNVSTATLTISTIDDAPRGSNFSHGATEDAEEIITLLYTDPEGDLSTSCSVTGETNLTETTPCACDGAGVCTVGVTGTADYNGAASFVYTVTSGILTSTAKTVSVTIAAGDDTPVAVNVTASDFTAGTQSIITLSYTDTENDKAQTCATSNLNDVTVTQACACNGAGVCTVGVTGVAGQVDAGSFDFTVTSNGLTSNTATASFNLICPSTYIEVPGALGAEFCVMQFEAKDSPTAGPGPAISVALYEPWTSISQDDAISACQAVGSKYDLISNPEWMTIAHNLEGVASNWDVFGTGTMNRGHSDGTPSNSLSVSDTNDPYDQTGNTGVFLQKRTHTLSNGLILWDFAGNVFEWVYWNKTSSLKKVTPANKAYGVGAPADTWIQFNTLINNITVGSQMEPSTWEALDPALDSTNGIGQYNSGINTTGGAAHRGGNWNQGDHAGIYALSLNQASALDSIGFRCVYRP